MASSQQHPGLQSSGRRRSALAGPNYVFDRGVFGIFLLFLALCSFFAELCAEDGAEEYSDGEPSGNDGQGCMVLDGQTMHEFGSELPFVHVALAHCAGLVAGVGGQVGTALVWHLDGEETGRVTFQPKTVRITMPSSIAAGPHELVVSLSTQGLPGRERTLDEAVYTFFSSDFRPRIIWEFPPEGYRFKRNSQRFLRFRAEDAGDQQRCRQEGAASCVGSEHFVYHASYYLNGQMMGEHLRQIYMLGLSGLGDGDYDALVTLSDSHNQPLGVNHSVHFSVRLNEEYVEDGSLPSALPPVTPCPTDTSEVCSASTGIADCKPKIPAGEPVCGQRGSLVQGVCQCEADYVGDLCEHHLLSSLTYLPQVDPAASPQRCGKSREWERAAGLLRERLAALQHMQELQDAAQCRNASRVAVVRLRATNGHAGFASFVEQVSGALNGGLRNGTMVYLQDFCDYFFHRGCPLRSTHADDLACYLDAFFSGCSPQQDWRPLPEYAKLGVFWWNAQLLRYIVSPNARLEAMVRAAKSAMGFRHPILGVHVRRGDSCKLKALPGYGMPLASCKTFADFMPHIRNFSALYGVKTVYVTSDSASVYREVGEFQGREGFSFIFTREDRGYYEHDWLLEMRLRMSLVDRKLVADSTLTDTLLLASCDYLILGLQSGYSRLALALAAAAKGYVPPYVSMDYPWMPRFGMSGPIPPWTQWWRDYP